MGCRVVASGEYNIRYWIKDIFSFIFWLKGRDFPKGFSIERHWKQVNEVVEKYMTPRGIETNEHRELLIVSKLGSVRTENTVEKAHRKWGNSFSK
jgi:hypothetical protein